MSLWWDCAPLAVAECLSARTPVLVPRLGGMPEGVREEVNGLTFAGLDIDDLAHQLDRLALEPGLLERMQASIGEPRRFEAFVDDLERCYAGERPGRISSPPAVDELEVRWQGDHDLNTSLSIINQRVVDRLPARVQRVRRSEDVGIDGWNPARSPAAPLLLPSPPLPGGAPLSHAADIEVRHQWPPDLLAARRRASRCDRALGFGAVPARWAEAIAANVDELWVPSEYVRRMYIGAGIDGDRVVVIPNGVDLEVFRPEGERFELPRPAAEAGGTRFLFVGGLVWRKAPDVLFDA